MADVSPKRSAPNPKPSKIALRGEQFQSAIFNAIPEQIAVIDADGWIVEANAAWHQHVDTPLAAIAAGDAPANYLEICKRSCGDDYDSFGDVGEGVSAILNGKRPYFEAEYRRSHGEEGERWFTLTASPLTGGGAVLVHEDVTERKILEREIFRISEYERRQIGMELHDGVCQVLGGMVLSIAVLAISLKKRDASETAEMSRLVDIARAATEQLRELSRSLYPVELEGHGLTAALHELARRVDERVPCSFLCPEEILISNSNTAVSIYRIAQEALNNAVRHSGAKNITLSLKQRRNQVTLKIEDDGDGFGDDDDHHAGTGLQIMRYRASAIGAHLQTQSTHGRGAQITCVVPI